MFSNEQRTSELAGPVQRVATAISDMMSRSTVLKSSSPFRYLTSILGQNQTTLKDHSAASTLFNIISQSTSSSLAIGSTPTLLKVPHDIIHAITTFLPWASVTSLRLTCKPLYHSIKAKNLHFEHPNLDNVRGEIHDFLELLCRGLPDHIPCFYCHKAHRVSLKPRDSNIHEEILSCLRADEQFGVWDRLHPDVGFTHLQYAMKLHTTGRDPTPYLGLLQRSDRTHSYTTKNICYVVSEARIDPVRREVIVRSQCWIVMPRAFLWGINEKRMENAFRTGCDSFEVCFHHDLTNSNELMRIVSCKIQHGRYGQLIHCWKCVGYGDFQKCTRCETEVHLEYRE